MSKILFKIFPLFDHLYIYQILEYNSWENLLWFFKNPFKRNLQKKHKLEWTQKAKLLFLVSILLLMEESLRLSFSALGTFWFSPLFFFLLILFSPIFLIISQLIIYPIEYLQKQKILRLAKEKLKTNPNLKIVAITGSFGKTSTKEALFTLLFKKYYVVKTPKSFNTPLGIAQTVLEDIKENTQIFICEVGAYKMGEIAKICKLINPQFGVITAIAPQHLEKFGSIENIAKAKFELPQSLDKEGIAILNSQYSEIKRLAPTVSSKIIFYGSKNDSFHASNIKVSLEGTSFTLNTPKGEVDINLTLIGEHHVQNFLSASTVAMQLGLTLSEIQKRASLILPTPHRLEIKKMGGVTLIDNTFNTNPKAARVSLKLLKDYPATQRIIVTPGLVELGKESIKENRNFAKEASKVVDEFILVGENAKKDLLKGLKDTNFPKIKIHLVNSTKMGLNLMTRISKPGAVVLLENDLPDQYF